MQNLYVAVILPVAIPKTYTYAVPQSCVAQVQVGVRVEVQFGKSKLYAGLVASVTTEMPQGYEVKPIVSVIDSQPIVTAQQLELWHWIAEYYLCTLGEVMNAALPNAFRLSSETKVVLNPAYAHDLGQLSDKEYLVAEALSIQNELSIEQIQDILNQKTVYPLLQKMLERGILFLQEELKTKYQPKTISCVRLQEPYLSTPEKRREAFELLTRSVKQTNAMLAYFQLEKTQSFVRKQEICDVAKVDAATVVALEKKGIFTIYAREVSRLGTYEDELNWQPAFTNSQLEAYQSVQQIFKKQNTVLLHGVTGSGKTNLYIRLIEETLEKGGQVLYLLPEIALTTQITQRLQKIFGNKIAVYHSRLSNNERVELWKDTLAGKPLLLGARSALFLPFSNLQLIVVDEEHDPSFKQDDPAPRYHARDAAIYLAQKFGAKVLLGSATPSLESYQNAMLGKYGLVTLSERFANLPMPEIILADMKEEQKQRKLQSHFTTLLLSEITAALERKEQIILFQNRRGYSPVLQCTACGWNSECVHCDVSLTYHKFSNNLRCHYCGYQTNVAQECPACRARHLTMKGFGTEKIEDELQIYFPDAKIKRMDLDTVRSKNAHATIINDFEEKRIDILVGTQMVTKGLDFDNVGLVGILSADQLLQFPDFRAGERAFQLMVQASGRAGRKNKRGKVVIQTFNLAHPVVQETVRADFQHLFHRELSERQTFAYPPFFRLISLTVKHKDPQVASHAAQAVANLLRRTLGKRVIGPAEPSISRIRDQYLFDIMIKMERKTTTIAAAKKLIADAQLLLQQEKKFSQVRMRIDVDPY